jgi:hypothetical protein
MLRGGNKMIHKPLKKWAAKTMLTPILATLIVVGPVSLPVAANDILPVDPPMVDVTLAPGESVTIGKAVTLPEVPPKLDLFLMVDLSGSYWNDLPVIRGLAPGIFDDVRADIPDSLFGLGSFIDFPFLYWGDPASGDYAYRLDQDLTAVRATWLAAVNAMATGNGVDGPESQYEALYQAATGIGKDLPGSVGDISAGQNASFRDGATSVIAITTDAPFHNPNDGGGPFPYPGPSEADTVAALNAKNIKVIAIKAPGATGQMDAIANATGGSVQTTGNTSEEIADAILAAFEELTFNVTAEIVGCEPLEISLDPAVYTDVLGGETVIFQETISVPADVTKDQLPADGRICCEVIFKADDSEIGRQEICVQVEFVPFDVKPQSCPNPLNVASKGVLPVAIVSTDEFDATQVDPETVRLEGVAPLRWSVEDVATPYDPYSVYAGNCLGCTTDGPDGIYDLTLKFKTQEVIGALGDVYNRQCKLVRITGQTFDGELIVGEDVLVILDNK